MTTKRVVVFGIDGQVATSLRKYFPEATFVNRKECDFERPSEISKILDKHNPKLVINPAAYTNVDKAESEREKAWLINSEAPGRVANWCAKNAADLIHFSTDYVYGGAGIHAWEETDVPAPVNFYGKTKLDGETAIAASGCRHIILRTSWVFSLQSQNFLGTMIKLGKENELVKIVADQVGCPTFADDLAYGTMQIANSPSFGNVSGIFNLVNSGSVSRFEFGNSIFNILNDLKFPLRVKRVEPVSSAAFSTPAKRPENSRLNTQKVTKTFGVKLRDWDKALAECLRQLSGQGLTN